jgi:hypothetical protein
MELSDIVPIALETQEKPSRREIQREVKKAKAIEKTKRKLKTAKKAERKLAVKAERVKANKRANSKRKLVKKIQTREANGTLQKIDTQVKKGEKKVFVKDGFGMLPSSL